MTLLLPRSCQCPVKKPQSNQISEQKHEYVQVVKKKIYGHILSVDVAPLKDQDRDTMYNMILEEAFFNIFGTTHAPVSLSTNCIDLAWTIRLVFRKYADQSVDRLFNLQPPLHGGQDTIAYRAGRV